MLVTIVQFLFCGFIFWSLEIWLYFLLVVWDFESYQASDCLQQVAYMDT